MAKNIKSVGVKSVRLNKTIREQIIDNIMESRDSKNAAPKVDSVTEGDFHSEVATAFKEQYAAEIKQYDDLTKAGCKFLSSTRSIGYYHNGHYKAVAVETGLTTYHDLDGHKTTSECRTYPDVLEGGYLEFHDSDVDDANKLKKLPKSIVALLRKKKKDTTKVRKQKAALKEWNSDRSMYRASVEEVVGGVNTTGQLLEVWPEVDRFLPKAIINPSNIMLPAVNVKALNEQLK